MDVLELLLRQKAMGHEDGESDEPNDNEQFAKEVQLIIAKQAFEHTGGNTAGQNWGQVSWVGTAANSIKACMVKRIEKVRRQEQQLAAQQMMGSVTEELDNIRFQAAQNQKVADEANDRKETIKNSLDAKESELQISHREYDTLHREMVALKITHRKMEEVTEASVMKVKRAERDRDTSAEAMRHLTAALQDLRDRHKKLMGESSQTNDSNARHRKRAETLARSLKETKEKIAVEREELAISIISGRKTAEGQLDSNNEVFIGEIEWRDERIHDLEETIRDFKGTELEHAQFREEFRALEDEVRMARQLVVSLLTATAKLGHFSIRKGGGYQSISEALAGVHRYVRTSPWGQHTDIQGAFAQTGDHANETYADPPASHRKTPSKARSPPKGVRDTLSWSNWKGWGGAKDAGGDEGIFAEDASFFPQQTPRFTPRTSAPQPRRSTTPGGMAPQPPKSGGGGSGRISAPGPLREPHGPSLRGPSQRTPPRLPRGL